MIAVLASGIVLGLAGSVHCVAMCGPLMLMVRRHSWLHHAGRLGTYATLGAAAGLGGSVIAGAGYARGLSVVAGLSLIIAAIGPRLHRVRRSARWSWIASAFTAVAHWRSRHGKTGAVAFGVLNGLLPCGLVYAAAGAAVTAADPLVGAAFMAAFGAGTIPALLVAQWVAGNARGPVSHRLRYAAPVALILLGALLITRGVLPRASDPGHAAHTALHKRTGCSLRFPQACRALASSGTLARPLRA